jgi:hypothetical protein
MGETAEHKFISAALDAVLRAPSVARRAFEKKKNEPSVSWCPFGDES